MRIERRCLETVFRKVTPDSVLESICKSLLPSQSDKHVTLYNDFSIESFHHYSVDLFNHFSNDEVDNFYNMMQTRIGNKKFAKKSLYNLLVDYADKVLFIDDKFPLVKYSEVLNWREMTNKLGQDLFTTAFLAYHDINASESTEVFSWKAILSTDNVRLHNILAKGMAENHFHLFGSTQIFTLSWISAMNHADNIAKCCDKFSKPLTRNEIPCERLRSTLAIELYRATIIRQYLFSIINGIKTMSLEDMLKDLDDPLLSDVMDRIEALRTAFGYRIDDKEVLDYALMSNMNEGNYNCNRALVGERNFMYRCFRKILCNQFTSLECNLFYLYIVIKSNFRSELIQSNDRVGFQNFSDYQDRKGYLFDRYEVYNNECINLALNTQFTDQSVTSVEARITPKPTFEKMRESIRNIDNAQQRTYNSSLLSYSDNIERITQKILDDKPVETTYKHFYVVHFCKGKETSKDCKDDIYPLRRHYSLYSNNSNMAKALRELISRDYSLRNRIKAIDGCSSEIGCRPEVLCQTIRSIVEYNPVDTSDNPFRNKEPFSLHKTYHAGEDFMGLVDGLRAIYETIYFVNLQRNDRIGHALALGIDPVWYYKYKENNITGTKQDLLDNFVWLIYYAQEKGINIESSLKSCLITKANEWFYDIYNKDKTEIVLNPGDNFYTYYQAYKLRGDPYEYYLLGRYTDDSLKAVSSQVLSCSLVTDSIRYSRDCINLYYCYMFNQKVKESGKECVIYKTDERFIQLVADVQSHLQKDISARGIGIECNPSSNKCISIFDTFEKHPIFSFNSIQGNNNQLFVSVNTDDLGVFDTSLENEYALLSRSLELSKDDNGNAKYTSESIYGWIDKIRENGINQTFR